MTHSKLLLFAVFSCLSLAVSGQVGVAYDLKKPAKFENRTLASEKSNDGKKFKKPRRFIQNTVTHYNYYFNANEKLNMVLAKAKAQFRDDYTRLLPFYNYTLDATLQQKRELDSVIYKCTAGILIHDTRNDWIDNLYLLIGKSFFFRKDFDSAFITFQFLNYAFAPKEKDGYDIPIGSNANADDGGNANIVSTKEKRNILQKVFSLPPSRNSALVWKVRTYLAANHYPEASSLIEVLKQDPQFPKRLQPELDEVQALLFYKQSIYDSAANYLEKALPAAADHEEMARWEYLIAQLYEHASRTNDAKIFYERTIRHTYNPVLEVYARLNAIRQTRDSSQNLIQKNIDALVKMAKKDRYESYRDIIYYTAAQMELERNNKPGAEAFLKRCIRSSAGSLGLQRNRAFLQLANLSYDEKKYRPAKNYYDSLNLIDPTSMGDISWLPDRKAALTIIAAQLNILDRQDSLQRIAALPPDQRNAYVNRLARTLRKQEGLRDEDQDGSSNNTTLNNNSSNAPPPDLFSNSSSGSAEWYFNNSSLKAKGYNDFRTKWGNRPNVDNWQLTSLVKQQQQLNRAADRAPGMPDIDGKAANAPAGATSFKSLMDNLPLTPEKLKKLYDSVELATYALGKAYQEGINDYPSAITAYGNLLEKFPDSRLREITLLNLYYCYKKIGDTTNAERILSLMKQRFPNSSFTATAINPDSAAQKAGSFKVNATHSYEKIYNSFIEGRFAEALADKQKADSLYGEKYWTPQLLYIESVYYIRNREDLKAIAMLNNIVARYAKTPMAAKAATMIDVLKRRKQIEDYLTKLEVKRATDDDTVSMAITTPPSTKTVGTPMTRNDSNMLVREDTSQLARARIPNTPNAGIKGQKPATGLPGADRLKVDTASMNKIVMTTGQLASLQRQIDSLHAAMEKAKSDSLQMAILRHRSDSIQTAMKKLQADSAQLSARIRSINSAFTNTPDKPHSVIIVLDKVDPVYVTEARNAYNRYNLENFYDKGLSIENTTLNDSLRLMVINTFPTADAALDYLQKAKAVAPREVIPWLPAAKYTFVIISVANLQTLMSGKDLPGYRKFLSAVYPGKFP